MTTFLLGLMTLLALGNEGPRGGDFIASQFVRRGAEVVDALQNDPANAALLTDEQREQIVFSLRRTPVASVEHALFDRANTRVDALTVDDPTSPTGVRIMLDRVRWEGLLLGRSELHTLVFHEYLWTIGADDENYRISRGLRVSSPIEAPSAWSEPLTLTVSASTLSLEFRTTDGIGDYGTLVLFEKEGKHIVHLNARRAARVRILSSSVVLCIDPELSKNVHWTKSGSTIIWCRR